MTMTTMTATMMMTTVKMTTISVRNALDKALRVAQLNYRAALIGRPGCGFLPYVPLAKWTSAPRSFEMICSAVCRFFVMIRPPFQIQKPHDPNIRTGSVLGGQATISVNLA